VGAFEAVLALVGAFFVLRIPERPNSQRFPLGVVAALAFGFSFLKLASRGRTLQGDFVIREGALWQQSGRFICGLPRGLFAYSEPSTESAKRTVVIDDGQLLLELEVRTEEQHRNLNSALGLATEPVLTGKSAARHLQLGGLIGSTVVALAGFVWALEAGEPFIAFALMALGLLGLGGSHHTHGRIGVDGIWVSGPSEQRFVGFAELRGVSAWGPWLRLHTLSKDIFISAPLLPFGRRGRAARAALVDFVRKRLCAWQENEAPLASARLTLAEGTFRNRELTAGDLARLAENPRAELLTRARAARELRQHHEWARFASGLRIAAAASASPALQQALSAAATSDAESEVDAAIRELEREARSG
jgi:hypothetical protein